MQATFVLLALSSVPDLFGYGARGLGMASTLTATAAGGEAVYYNPANLAFSKHPSFSVGFHWADAYLSIGGESRDAEASPATTISFDVPLPFTGALAERLTLGFGFVLPVGAVLVADIPRPVEPRFVRIDRRADTVSLMGALGVRVLDDLAIGAGFIALAELEGAIDVAPNENGRIGTEVRDQLVADYALTVGASYRMDAWAFGLVFRDESAAEFELPITAELGEQFPLPIPRLDVSGTAQFDPRQLVAAATWRLMESLALSGSIGWEQWSRYENPIVYTAVPPGYPAQPAPNFHDVVTGRIAGELTLGVGEAWLIPRAGIAVSPSPVPADSNSRYLDAIQVVPAAGLGLRYGRFRADGAVQAKILDGGWVLATALELGVAL